MVQEAPPVFMHLIDLAPLIQTEPLIVKGENSSAS